MDCGAGLRLQLQHAGHHQQVRGDSVPVPHGAHGVAVPDVHCGGAGAGQAQSAGTRRRRLGDGQEVPPCRHRLLRGHIHQHRAAQERQCGDVHRFPVLHASHGGHSRLCLHGKAVAVQKHLRISSRHSGRGRGLRPHRLPIHRHRLLLGFGLPRHHHFRDGVHQACGDDRGAQDVGTGPVQQHDCTGSFSSHPAGDGGANGDGQFVVGAQLADSRSGHPGTLVVRVWTEHQLFRLLGPESRIGYRLHGCGCGEQAAHSAHQLAHLGQACVRVGDRLVAGVHCGRSDVSANGFGSAVASCAAGSGGGRGREAAAVSGGRGRPSGGGSRGQDQQLLIEPAGAPDVAASLGFKKMKRRPHLASLINHHLLE